jgi:toxin ParE1/3/4
MAVIVWSHRAADDLNHACEYLGLNSPAYAAWFGEQVLLKIESAAEQPFLGAMVPEYQMETLRERRLNSYRIIYRVHRDGIQVVAIIHGAQQLPGSAEF